MTNEWAWDAMLRERMNEDLKSAMKARAPDRVAALRLILAAVKDREIAGRLDGKRDEASDAEIVEVLQKMVRQRQESILLYRQGGREELAAKEEGEIAIIQSYLPRQMETAEQETAVAAVIAELGASSIKDMGKVMAALKARFAGRMDFAKVGAQVKAKLG
jgi:uncharacterized protein